MYFFITPSQNEKSLPASLYEFICPSCSSTKFDEEHDFEAKTIKIKCCACCFSMPVEVVKFFIPCGYNFLINRTWHDPSPPRRRRVHTERQGCPVLQDGEWLDHLLYKMILSCLLFPQDFVARGSIETKEQQFKDAAHVRLLSRRTVGTDFGVDMALPSHISPILWPWETFLD